MYNVFCCHSHYVVNCIVRIYFDCYCHYMYPPTIQFCSGTFDEFSQKKIAMLDYQHPSSITIIQATSPAPCCIAGIPLLLFGITSIPLVSPVSLWQLQHPFGITNIPVTSLAPLWHHQHYYGITSIPVASPASL